MRSTVDTIAGVGVIPPPNHPQFEFPVAANDIFDELNELRGKAVAKSLEKSMRSIVTLPPPVNQPQLEFPNADIRNLATLNGPLTDTGTESLEKSIRSTLDTIAGTNDGLIPPPHQP